MGLTIVKNATCTFCGCVCDDMELHADGDRIIKAKNACSLGDAHFKYHTAEHLYPDALIDGKPATVDEAIQALEVEEADEIAHRDDVRAREKAAVAGKVVVGKVNEPAGRPAQQAHVVKIGDQELERPPREERHP